jgi:hypothetical protein
VQDLSPILQDLMVLPLLPMEQCMFLKVPVPQHATSSDSITLTIQLITQHQVHFLETVLVVLWILTLSVMAEHIFTSTISTDIFSLLIIHTIECCCTSKLILKPIFLEPTLYLDNLTSRQALLLAPLTDNSIRMVFIMISTLMFSWFQKMAIIELCSMTTRYQPPMESMPPLLLDSPTLQHVIQHQQLNHP